MKIVVASRNQGKIQEVSTLLAQLEIEVCSMEQVGVCQDFPEEGQTFRENALSKAHALAAVLGHRDWTLGDDSGLEVAFLQGAPGVFSARWAGVERRGGDRDRANNDKLLVELAEVDENQRQARFVCCLALVGPAGQEIVAQGVCHGRILRAPRGNNGFGYDPLFLPAGFERTMAQLSTEEKNRISHRGQALVDLYSKIKWIHSSPAG